MIVFQKPVDKPPESVYYQIIPKLKGLQNELRQSPRLFRRLPL
jgi:hypothetical protein